MRIDRLRAPLAALAAGSCALCALGGSLALPSAAHAAWSDAQLASVDNGRLEQADGASTAVDLSGDGRWVVFATRASNFFADDDPDPAGRMRQGGIFRFDRVTGAIALVADGDQLDEATGDLLLRGASAPSVSDDGRFVAFATAQRLVPQDGNDNIDVYVRDMLVPLQPDRPASGAYRLVSARDGGDEPATYAESETPLPGRNPGAAVLAGQAISGDGRHVAFRTTELASDLPALDALDAPAGSVFVRDLAAKRTVLVSARLDGAGSAGGALAPVVLSRDGSTVAWVGEQAPQQTAMLPGENLDAGQRYYLWRRWDEPGASTRRITGMADLDDPACGGGTIASSPTAAGPCYGPLTDVEGFFGDISGRPPALSADGWTVAFLTGAGPRPSVAEDNFLDAYVTSMRPGLSRKAATRVLTKGTTAANARANGDVESVTLSGDGTRLALVTARREFLPPAPPMISTPRPSLAVDSELYVVDLERGVGIRRPLTPGGGELSGGLDANPAFSADGRAIAFVTRSSNLVPGDANELPDVFVVQETDDTTTAPPPAGLGDDAVDLDLGSADDELSARVTARRDGTLLLRVRVPEAGALRALARTRPARAAGGGRGSRRAGRRASRRAARRAARPRQVASARGRAARAATVRIVLSLRGRDRAAVRRGTPLPVRVAVTLTPSRSGAKARTTTAAATFRFKRRVVKRRAVTAK